MSDHVTAKAMGIPALAVDRTAEYAQAFCNAVYDVLGCIAYPGDRDDPEAGCAWCGLFGRVDGSKYCEQCLLIPKAEDDHVRADLPC